MLAGHGPSAAGCRFGCGCSGRGTALRLFARSAEERGGVVQDGVDLPPFAVGCTVDPELVLLGVAAGGAPLVDGRKTGLGQSGLLGVDGVDVDDFHAEVVEGAPRPGFSSSTSLSGGSAIAKLA